MFGSQILEVAIGLVLVYLLIGLIVSVLNELIAQALALRATTLEQGLRRLLEGETKKGASGAAGTGASGTGPSDLVQRLYEHPLICGISSTTRTYRPSYIPSPEFALALLNLVAPEARAGSPTYWEQLEASVDEIENKHRQQALLVLLADAQRDEQRARANIERWFDDAMDRVSGWYKRKVRMIVLALGLLLSVLLNADTTAIAQALWSSSTIRAGAVAAAQEYVTSTPPQDTNRGFPERVREIDGALGQLQALQLPLGWTAPPQTVTDVLRALLGLALTTLAVSLGAPFWFDTLNKFMTFRATGKLPAAEREVPLLRQATQQPTGANTPLA